MAIIINGTNTPTAGAVAVGDGTTLAFTAAGLTGQVLQSNGAGVPTWVTGASGTVSSTSVVSANGFAGTVANPSSTPAITLTTSITGVLKGNGTALSAATAGTDYVAPGGALGTPSSGTLSGCTVDGTDAVGFRNIPQNAQTGNYTMVLADAGKHIYHASGAGAAAYTIPAATSVAYPLGTAITFINLSSTSITIVITTDTMYLSSAGTTGTRTLAQYGSATAIKVSGVSSSGIWVISGSGLT